MENQSEVARILAQIEAEYEAAQWGLTGLAEGTSRHDFITSKMENMMLLHGDLGAIVGKQEAMKLISDHLGD
jgi:hypothetical protein